MVWVWNRRGRCSRRAPHEAPKVDHPPSAFSSAPPLLVSWRAAGALTQAGDVGPATWRRHNTLGVATWNVVVNLSS